MHQALPCLGGLEHGFLCLEQFLLHISDPFFSFKSPPQRSLPREVHSPLHPAWLLVSVHQRPCLFPSSPPQSVVITDNLFAYCLPTAHQLFTGYMHMRSNIFQLWWDKHNIKVTMSTTRKLLRAGHLVFFCTLVPRRACARSPTLKIYFWVNDWNIKRRVIPIQPASQNSRREKKKTTRKQYPFQGIKVSMFLLFLMWCSSEFNANWILLCRLVHEHGINWAGLLRDGFLEEEQSLHSWKESYPAARTGWILTPRSVSSGLPR